VYVSQAYIYKNIRDIFALYIIYYNELMTRGKKSSYFRYIVIIVAHTQKHVVLREIIIQIHI